MSEYDWSSEFRLITQYSAEQIQSDLVVNILSFEFLLDGGAFI